MWAFSRSTFYCAIQFELFDPIEDLKTNSCANTNQVSCSVQIEIGIAIVFDSDHDTDLDLDFDDRK